MPSPNDSSCKRLFFTISLNYDVNHFASQVRNRTNLNNRWKLLQIINDSSYPTIRPVKGCLLLYHSNSMWINSFHKCATGWIWKIVGNRWLSNDSSYTSRSFILYGFSWYTIEWVAPWFNYSLLPRSYATILTVCSIKFDSREPPNFDSNHVRPWRCWWRCRSNGPSWLSFDSFCTPIQALIHALLKTSWVYVWL